MRRKKAERALSGVLAGCMALCCAAPARAADDGVGIICDEAYYATTDYYGNLTEGSVVKSYVLNGATTLKDRGVYDEVLNLTDDTEPEIRGSALTFRLKEPQTHFYFEGKTAKPFENLPWTISVHYALNGVPARAEELAGKTGVVEIAVDAVPNEAASEYARHNYVLAVNAAFNQDDILSLEAPGAQVQLVGNLRVALTLCLPGEEQHFTIRVGAEKFSFSGLTFLLMPATLSQLEQIAELSQRKDDIEDNYHKLAGSLDDLLDALENVSGNLYGSAGGLDALNSARATVSEGKGEVYDKADALRADLDVINGELEPVTADLENVSAVMTDAKGILESANTNVLSLKDDLKELETYIKGMQENLQDVIDTQDQIDDIRRDIRGLRRGFDTVSSMPGTTISSVEYDRSLPGNLIGVKQLHAAYEKINSGEELNFTSFAVAQLVSQNVSANEAASALANYSSGVETTLTSHIARLAEIYAAASGSLTNSMDFEEFVTAYYLGEGADLESAQESSSSAAKLWAIYHDNPGTVETMIEESDAIGDAVNSSILKVNTGLGNALNALKATANPASDLCRHMDELLNDLEALYDVLYEAKRMGTPALSISAKTQKILDDMDALHSVLDEYEPKAQEAIRSTTALIGTTRESLTHMGEFSDALKDLMQRSGEQLDSATKKSLSNLAASLRSTAAALDKNEKVRTAKDAIEGIVEDVWDEHTGDIDNLLLMDTEAEIESLTSAHNPTPQSVQILIRTQEIEIPEEPAADAAVPAKSVTFLDRVAQMFRDFWAAITGIFRR